MSGQPPPSSQASPSPGLQSQVQFLGTPSNGALQFSPGFNLPVLFPMQPGTATPSSFVSVLPSQNTNQPSPQPNQPPAANQNDTKDGESSISLRQRGRKRGGTSKAPRGSTAAPRGTSNPRARGSTAAPSGTPNPRARKPPRSWTGTRNADGKSEMDLIVDWLTVEANYSSWRNDSISKRQVCELICDYLQAHGFPERRPWKGVNQQITQVETKFREAQRWKEQTGQGIMD
ncbi:hypothetical protein PTTG_25331 [Puccinia triticina 1-1 BBBD Race 1]|uniref:Uncharacterized protein n=1 Tax=Puccinia triticina (isolate 1-1 / race 1 (BBBD)) TaxID=630390 RepID=A0A180H378_PUCT1|nr:hypothetical protein PTTG_25331 [Puccinia triticina 1-1 BBBD Race 1]